MSPSRSRVLVLGGTGEARSLAGGLVADGIPVVSSLAGRVSAPALPEGGVRLGGFGGVEGLVDFLAAEHISAVVDATHPFAAGITANAARACTASGVPLVRLQRAGWEAHRSAASFVWVDSVDEARAAAEEGRRPFVTTGRQQLERFAAWADRYVLVRVVDPPEWALPTSWEVVRSRGPYDLEAERALMLGRGIDVLLTKNSGGEMTEAKLQAAVELQIPVVVVRRPGLPDGVAVVDTVAAAHEWLVSLRFDGWMPSGPRPG